MRLENKQAISVEFPDGKPVARVSGGDAVHRLQKGLVRSRLQEMQNKFPDHHVLPRISSDKAPSWGGVVVCTARKKGDGYATLKEIRSSGGRRNVAAAG